MSEMLAPPHGQSAFISIVQCIRLVNYQRSISTIKMGIYNLWILGKQSIKDDHEDSYYTAEKGSIYLNQMEGKAGSSWH